MKRSYFVLSLPLFLLSACGGNSAPAESSAEGALTQFYLNDGTDTVSFELRAGADGLLANPGKPGIRNHFVFDGWFTEKEGGEKFDFSYKAPSALYAHWHFWNGAPRDQKVLDFVDAIKELTPLTVKTYGDVDIAYQSQQSGGVMTMKDIFVAKRYEELVQTEHYYPKYYTAETDLSDDQKEEGITIEQANEQALTQTVQDYYEDGTFYSLHRYNKNNPAVDKSASNYREEKKVDPDKAEAYMAIDFSSYFLGGVNALYGLLANKNWSASEVQSKGRLSLGANAYYIKGLDPTAFDSKATGLNFEVAYTRFKQGSEYSMTTLYESSGSVALVNGKILHAQVVTVNQTYVDSDLMEQYTFESMYDFTPGESFPSFEGERLVPKDFPLPETED